MIGTGERGPVEEEARGTVPIKKRIRYFFVQGKGKGEAGAGRFGGKNRRGCSRFLLIAAGMREPEGCAARTAGCYKKVWG